MPAGRASWRTTASTTPLPRSWTSSSLNSNSSYRPNQPSTKARIAAWPSKMSPNARPSRTASTAKLLITASISRRFAASNCLRTSSTRSWVVDSDIGLRPLLGEAFGGNTGLIDVAIAGRSHDNVLRPYEDACLAQPNPARASGRTGAVTEDGKNDSAAEIENLFGLDLKLLVRAEPVFKEAADHRPTLEGAEPPR